MNGKEKMTAAATAIALPMALWVFGACQEQFDPEACEEQGGTLECYYSDGEYCADPEEMGCSCDCVVACESDSDCNEDEECLSGSCEVTRCTSDFQCEGDATCNAAGDCVGGEAAETYRFVMIEAFGGAVVEPFPGSDIDAIGLSKAGESSISTWLAEIEDAEDSSGVRNDAASPTAVLGPPDADCDVEAIDRFYSLGGAGSYLVGNFGACDPSNGEVTGCIENGDSISVVELGNSECGMYEDDEYDLSVSVSSNGTFVEVGSGIGSDFIFIDGLP